MEFTSFEQVIRFMEHFMDLEKHTDKKETFNRRTYRLDRMAALLDHLGNPQKSYKTIHVAGSKGKGSTASYLASGIQALGYKTGLYMSPHVSDYRERFTLCGQFFDDEILISTGNLLAEKLEGFSFDDKLSSTLPTTFEMYTAFAFLLFKNAGCSYAVIETGLGGRLDATNVILPQASVLTPIELEHTEILGDTIAKIAVEKSKIIKPGVPVFSAIQKPEALKVFEEEAKVQHSELYSLERNLKEFSSRTTEAGQVTHLVFNDGFTADLTLKMEGKVQAQNSALALLVLRNLSLYKEGVTEKALEKVTLPGRMEKINWKRPLFIDGAHTPQSMKGLLETFSLLYPEKNGTCIFGCVQGKDYETMGNMILNNFDRIIVSKPGTFKKSNPKLIFDYLMKNRKNHDIRLIENASEALKTCLELTQGPILVCGSFYMAGEIKEALCL